LSNANLPLGQRGIWVPASTNGWFFASGTWTNTRIAAGNYYQLKTAGAATTIAVVNLARAVQRALSALPVSVNVPMGSEVQAGGLLTGIDLVYSIGTAALTSLTPLAYQTSYVNNVAASINASPGGAISLVTLSAVPVATQTNPYSVAWQFATPYLIGANGTGVADFLEFSIVDAGSSVFGIYGILLKFNANR
jgi:hypothetical protein